MDVTLAFDDESFTGRLRLMVDAAKVLGAELAKAEATWEPHDWSEF
jgi:hypothetical protein